MATGIISTLPANSSITYTPNNDAKIKITCFSISSGNASVSVNGVDLFITPSGTSGNFNFDFYAAAGTPFTIVTNSAAACLISSLESY